MKQKNILLTCLLWGSSTRPFTENWYGGFDSHATLVQELKGMRELSLSEIHTSGRWSLSRAWTTTLPPEDKASKSRIKKHASNCYHYRLNITNRGKQYWFQGWVKQDREHWHLGAEGCRAGWGPLRQRWKGRCSNGLREPGEPCWRPTRGPSLWSCLGQACHSSIQVGWQTEAEEARPMWPSPPFAQMFRVWGATSCAKTNKAEAWQLWVASGISSVIVVVKSDSPSAAIFGLRS